MSNRKRASSSRRSASWRTRERSTSCVRRERSLFNHHRHEMRATIHESSESIASPSSLVSVGRPEPRPSETGGLNLEELLDKTRAEGFADGVASVVAEHERIRTDAI